MTNILLDSETADRIVRNERKIYAHEVDGMQREKGALLNGQPYNNAVLLLANIIMAGLFFYVTSLNADSVLPASVSWAQPLVGGVSAIGAASLMYATNAIAYKLPTIKDRKSAIMMWSAWISMLIISAITSAFLALLLVNGADSRLDTARMSMAQAERIAGVETAAVLTATTQLGKWSENAATARADRSAAMARLATAEADYTKWQNDTMARFGQGSADGNKRLRDETHYEHKPHIDAIASAKAAAATATADVTTADTRIREWETKLRSAEQAQAEALSRSNTLAVTEVSPWDETMADMASMMQLIGLNFEGGAQFKATFAVFFALVMTLAPPFWSYQTGAGVAPEVDRQAARMTEIDRRAKEARQSFTGGAGGFAAPSLGGVEAPAGPPGPAVTSETASMGSIVDFALGLDEGNQTLPCGLTQERFEKLYTLNFDRVQRLQQDAEGKLLKAAGVGVLKSKYGGNDDVARMLKHVLFLEGYGEYAADGSISLFNPVEA